MLSSCSPHALTGSTRLLGIDDGRGCYQNDARGGVRSHARPVTESTWHFMTRARYINIPEDDRPLWVFGYGSLMWDPGFDHETRLVATIYGLHRRLCVSSIRYRGTPQSPGLVLGLDRGGSCVGYAYRVNADSKHEVVEYLEDREMVNNVYKPVFVNARLVGCRRERVLTFRVRRDHPQYIPPMCERQLAERILRCRGQRGPNRDYVINTLRTLRDMGFDDRGLDRVARHLGHDRGAPSAS